MIKKADQRRQFTLDCGSGQTTLLELSTPGQDVHVIDCAEFLGAGQANKTTAAGMVARCWNSAAASRRLPKRVRFARSGTSLAVLMNHSAVVNDSLNTRMTRIAFRGRHSAVGENAWKVAL